MSAPWTCPSAWWQAEPAADPPRGGRLLRVVSPSSRCQRPRRTPWRKPSLTMWSGRLWATTIKERHRRRQRQRVLWIRSDPDQQSAILASSRPLSSGRTPICDYIWTDVLWLGFLSEGQNNIFPIEDAICFHDRRIMLYPLLWYERKLI